MVEFMYVGDAWTAGMRDTASYKRESKQAVGYI
jgi:hypothetical protein